MNNPKITTITQRLIHYAEEMGIAHLEYQQVKRMYLLDQSKGLVLSSPKQELSYQSSTLVTIKENNSKY
jgi:hypothetical protein